MKKNLLMLMLYVICFGLLMFSGCRNIDSEDKTSDVSTSTTKYVPQSIYDRNVEIIQSVEGYDQERASEAAKWLQIIVAEGFIPNEEIVSAENCMWRDSDIYGEYEIEYLRFETADKETYYAIVDKYGFISEIERGSIESKEYVWFSFDYIEKSGDGSGTIGGRFFD